MKPTIETIEREFSEETVATRGKAYFELLDKLEEVLDDHRPQLSDEDKKRLIDSVRNQDGDFYRSDDGRLMAKNLFEDMRLTNFKVISKDESEYEIDLFFGETHCRIGIPIKGDYGRYFINLSLEKG